MEISRREALGRLAAFVGLAVVARPLVLRAEDAKPFQHPDPRPGITGEHVLTHEQVGKRSQKVYDAYDAARAYPEIFDGIYCTCDCKNTSLKHRSLLECFESMQPTGCMACQEDGELVGKLAKQGKSLADVRKAIDEEYG